MMVGKKRKKIAVLGGGIGALSAAFHLTETEGWDDEYDITIYQPGWRLGGKCASGRDIRPGYGHRIYEHGLHLFGGFYHHAFDLMRRAYGDLGRTPDQPNATVWDAFTGLDEVTLLEAHHQPDGSIAYEPWYINLEPNDLKPGEATSAPTVAEMVLEMVGQLIKYQPPNGIFSGPKAPFVRNDDDDPETVTRDDDRTPLEHAFDMIQGMIDTVEQKFIEGAVEVGAHIVMRTVVKRIEDHLRAIGESAPTPGGSQTIANFLNIAFLVQAIVLGVFEDKVLTEGWDSIDDQELSAWIRKHAVTVARDFKGDDDPYERADALLNWSPIRAIYDYVFGYRDGDPNQRALAAGTGMRGMLKLALNYRGHFFWMMRGGMGDVVIAPLYLALKKRGVKFKFFHRVTALRPTADRRMIDRIEILEQAKVTSGDYAPLIDTPVDGWDKPLEAWPNEPLWDQLVDGDALKGTNFEFAREPVPPSPNLILKHGVDFDEVVLGIPIGALHTICADLAVQYDRWKQMLARVETCPTLALQLWLRRTTDDLGAVAGRTMTAMPQPFSTWADMTHVLTREQWHGKDRPLSLAYFCGQIPPEIARDDTAVAEVGKVAASYLTSHGQTLWPRGGPVDGGKGIDPKLLFDPEHRSGDARFNGQYWRANIDPSELYVMSVPGSTTKRLRANESGYENLFLCGDWTRNGLNAGAAEAAAMSGLQCANAMRGDICAVMGELD
jgi:uncharacterized protein with NAD-binding domain and iron-sulfur cluster